MFDLADLFTVVDDSVGFVELEVVLFGIGCLGLVDSTVSFSFESLAFFSGGLLDVSSLEYEYLFLNLRKCINLMNIIKFKFTLVFSVS